MKTGYQNHLYNRQLQPYAKELRKSMTKAEVFLWKYVLRAGNMKGYHFRRQRPIMNFIADFVCLSLKLVIEVDGITHHDEKAIIKHLNRQRLLEQEGFCILRFSDNEVLNRIEGVAKEIEDWIERFEIANGISGPPLSPPPAGNGATA